MPPGYCGRVSVGLIMCAITESQCREKLCVARGVLDLAVLRTFFIVMSGVATGVCLSGKTRGVCVNRGSRDLTHGKRDLN